MALQAVAVENLWLGVAEYQIASRWEHTARRNRGEEEDKKMLDRFDSTVVVILDECFLYVCTTFLMEWSWERPRT